MDTIQGNKLIAEFMSNGFMEYEEPIGKVFLTDFKFIIGKSVDAEFLFNTSWDWLMPVVEKIRDVCELGTLGNTISYLMSRIIRSYTNLDNINDLWAAVVNWIESYNCGFESK